MDPSVTQAAGWLDLDVNERRERARRAARAPDTDALWSLTEAWLDLEHGSGVPVSPHTKRVYRRSIGLLLANWQGEQVLQASPEDARRLIETLGRSGIRSSSTKVYLAGMRALYSALHWAGAVEANPFRDVRAEIVPSEHRVRRERYTPEEYDRLLAVAERGDRVLILLVGETGLNVEEALSLRWTDIDLPARIARVRRGSRERVVQLGDRTQLELSTMPHSREWVLDYRSDVRARQRLERLSGQARVPYRGVAALRPKRPLRASYGHPQEVSPYSASRAGGPQLPGLQRLEQELSSVLAETRRSGIPAGLLMIRINNFSGIVREHGAEAGRTVLGVIAARSAHGRRPYDLVAQVDDETLAVLLKHVPSNEVLRRVVRRFQSSVSRYPISILDQSISVSVIVGASMHIGEPEELMRNAREALDRAMEEHSIVQPAVSSDQTLAIARTCLTAFNAGDRAAFRAVFAPGAVLRDPAMDRSRIGPDAITLHAFAWRELYPDVQGEITEVVVSDGQAFLRLLWDATGRRAGAIAAGRLTGYVVLRVRQGKINSLHHYLDRVGELALLSTLLGDEGDDGSQMPIDEGKTAVP